MASRLTTFIVVFIVTGTVIAGLIVGAQREDFTGPVDLIVTNGRVFTGADRELAEAIAIQGNKILHVGSNREIKRLRSAQTLMLDAHGASILPGFIDAHVHLAEAAAARAGVDLSDAGTTEALALRIRAFAEAHPDAEWIRGRGWSYDLFPNGLPTRQALDEIVPDRPAYLVAEDGRTAWANSKALKLAGITRRTPNPKGGLIVRDPRTGDATGALREAAQALVADVLPPPTPTEQLEGLEAAIREAHSVGVTSVHSVGDTIEGLELYDALRSAGALQLRVYSALAIPAWSETEAARLDAIQQRYPDDPLLKTGAVVVGPDAAQPSASAARRTVRTAADLAALVTHFDARGWQTIVEASTREEIEAALDAFESAQRANPSPERRRHRVDYTAGVEEGLTGRLAAIGVAVGVGPRTESDPATWRLILDAGGRVAFGSDWPASLPAPGERLAAAAQLVDDDDDPATEGKEPRENRQLALAEAIEASTATPAWASFDDQRKGRIERGMLADLVILNTDIFRPDADPSSAVVEATIFDGKVVYSRTPIGTH
ncbi:MAG TPA: amidohydrolase [Vicinamibacterales bacterium]|nr:amidohydrolase [Vicinamibacterales bacterium]